MRVKRKKCAFCGKRFVPDPRVGNRQQACHKEACKRERKARAQKRWQEKNPGYFRGRYQYVKEWLGEHPGYLAQYRLAHPEYVERNRQRTRERTREAKRGRFDIQDEIKSQLIDIAQVKPFKVGFDIQDEIRTQQACLARVMLNLLGLIYKTRLPPAAALP